MKEPFKPGTTTRTRVDALFIAEQLEDAARLCRIIADPESTEKQVFAASDELQEKYTSDRWGNVFAFHGGPRIGCVTCPEAGDWDEPYDRFGNFVPPPLGMYSDRMREHRKKHPRKARARKPSKEEAGK